MKTQLPLLATAIAVCAFLPSTSVAQEDAQAPQKPDPQAVLEKGLTTMSALKSVKFRTTETQNSAMSRTLAKQMGGAAAMLGGGGDIEVRGTWAEGLLKASLNEAADEIISYRGRMVARNDDVSWKPRRNRLAGGGKLDFVLDPGQFFEALSALPAKARKVLHSTPGTYRDTPVQILGLTLKGTAAQDFALSGALPTVSQGMGMGMVMRRAMGGGGSELPDLTVDLALTIDPATGIVHKVKTSTYQSSPAAGAMRVQIQGAGLGGGDEEEEEEEEVKEKDANGKRIYKLGLPVRGLGDDLSKMGFDIRFSKPDEVAPIKLEPAVKKLLKR